MSICYLTCGWKKGFHFLSLFSKIQEVGYEKLVLMQRLVVTTTGDSLQSFDRLQPRLLCINEVNQVILTCCIY